MRHWTIPQVDFYIGLHKPNTCTHGPQVWKWWHLFSWTIPNMQQHDKYTLVWRLWVYTRWWARCFDIYIWQAQP